MADDTEVAALRAELAELRADIDQRLDSIELLLAMRPQDIEVAPGTPKAAIRAFYEARDGVNAKAMSRNRGDG